ncbi:MAG: UDP-N-acetylglucosamine--N-acetylmuramyl-(pentapeptide) pyrophosphoryl-undecaprenol N-acetylglucosamine transferase [Frankiaceae bacterium]
MSARTGSGRLRSVVLAAGGSAGHVEPALAVADALRAAHPDVVSTVLGTAEGPEAQLVPARGYALSTIPRVPLPRSLSWDLVAVPWRLVGAQRAAAAALRDTRADVVVGFGGYVSAPAYLAARLHAVPIVVHEANSLPGLANRMGARLTRHVAVSTPETPLPHAVLTGIPLRRVLLTSRSSQQDPAARAAARRSLGLDPDRPTLLAFGGSLGAAHLNTAMVGAAARLAAAGIQVLHSTGTRKYADVVAGLRRAGITTSARGTAASSNAARGTAASGTAARGTAASGTTAGGTARSAASTQTAPYVAVPYLSDMPAAYAAADLAVCRAGAITCAELGLVGLPAVYVPLPVGNGEQRLNALPMVRAGGGVMIENEALSGDELVARIVPLVTDPARLAEMRSAAGRSGRTDAAQRVVRLIEEATARPTRKRRTQR